MTIKKTSIFSILFLSLYLQAFSQNNLYSAATIPEELTKHANAVVRLNETTINLKSTDQMITNVKRVITVINKKGNKYVNAYVHYDNGVRINELQALVYDNFGNEIKKIKKKDFIDHSAVDGGTLYSDSRVKYLKHTPISYPYTIEFIYETVSENTAFIPSFQPIESYYVSTQQNSFTVINSEDITIRKKEMRLEGLELTKEENSQINKYVVKNLKAIKPEDRSPTLSDVTPKVLFAANNFTLEGVSGQVENWEDFGKWMYQDLIKDTQNLPVSTVNTIKNLVKNEVNDIEKAKKIYQYVQDKTRYISVQVGIGGWKPFDASEVDRLSYGDCKALTNYTLSLLKVAEVESNYTVIFAGKSQRSIDEDFASMQGNHVILSVPNEKDTLWLECTSQKLPFGFIGDFTDDRDALVITPEGGKIMHTKKYTINENTQIISGNYMISPNGSIDVDFNMVSKGIQYDNRYWLDYETDKDLDTHYKNYWDYINNITIQSIDLINDKDAIAFHETIKFEASNYATMVGDRMLVVLNAMGRNTYIPDRYRNRKLPLKINRGYKDTDNVEITLPEGYKIEALPDNRSIKNKFGSYLIEITRKDENTLSYKRELIINDGQFPKEDYKDFRNFYKEITKYDNSKISLIKK